MADSRPAVKSIAIIASFRRMMPEVAQARAIFVRAGLIVRSPLHDEPLDPGEKFVRFVSDDGSDAYVQSVALHRIMGADLVYVVATEGYVGRTTCYEIGRLVQAGLPMVFSQRPLDLPIHVTDNQVLAPDDLVAQLSRGATVNTFDLPRLDNSQLEADLRVLSFRDL